jgi:hypothetical protein
MKVYEKFMVPPVGNVNDALAIVRCLLLDLVDDASKDSVELPPLTTGQRKEAKLVEEYDSLIAKEVGSGPDRRLHVCKSASPVGREQRQKSAKQKKKNERASRSSEQVAPKQKPAKYKNRYEVLASDVSCDEAEGVVQETKVDAEDVGMVPAPSIPSDNAVAKDHRT